VNVAAIAWQRRLFTQSLLITDSMNKQETNRLNCVVHSDSEKAEHSDFAHNALMEALS
jgi:hypothetical protein